jgi:hypothetical protein
MRDQWYADKRDIVKWSTLLLIAEEYHSECIFQIAYFRKSDYGKLQIDGREYDIPPEVIHHFRNITKIAELTSQHKIIILDKEFVDRNIYLNEINNYIDTNQNSKRGIVFLDQDTGLEPVGKASHKHVLEHELKSIWGKMPSGWILVLYQHKTNKNSQEWIKPKRKQFAESINIPVNDIKIASGFAIANDVVFFFAVKHDVAGDARPTF